VSEPTWGGGINWETIPHINNTDTKEQSSNTTPFVQSVGYGMVY